MLKKHDVISRRAFASAGTRLAAGLATVAAACRTAGPTGRVFEATAAGEDEADFVIVGSGAGGGPLAANLARYGYRVLVLEAGDRDDDAAEDYAVPAFHPYSSEDARLSWSFFVKHYSENPERDTKYRKDRGGIFYPRASTIGGCTSHHAMIMVYPFNSDFEQIVEATGDKSWDPVKMRGYFMRLEANQYTAPDEAKGAAHGLEGWLPISMPDIAQLSGDPTLLSIAASAVLEEKGFIHNSIGKKLDLNHWNLVKQNRQGTFPIPISVKNGRRSGVREYLLATQAEFPDRLIIRTGALATRVVFDDKKKAIGVEYLEGKALYKADPMWGQGAQTGVERFAKAKREVIVAGGAFNTPQLLKLSGVGPRDELTRFGIPVVQDLPGVGENLQDRYEIGVVWEMNQDFKLLQDCSFSAPNDACLIQWKNSNGGGPYASNGGLVAVVQKSNPDLKDPDLFIFGLPGNFRGYSPLYSRQVFGGKNFFTWAVLKARAGARGSVTLKSKDPRDPPDINFRYFDDKVGATQDLKALEKGLRTARTIMNGGDILAGFGEEVWPGAHKQSSDTLHDFFRNEAWGHHASCTAKMGRREDRKAVVDSRFRVHGVQGLRVCDASIFPQIPGFFVCLPVYMVAEKASDVIAEDHPLKG